MWARLCPLCISLWRNPLCVWVNQTFIVLFWDDPSVQNYEICLAVDKGILKSESGQIAPLQPCQQMLWMCLFGKRAGENGTHIHRCVQIIACKAGTWSVRLSVSLGLLSYAILWLEYKAETTTQLLVIKSLSNTNCSLMIWEVIKVSLKTFHNDNHAFVGLSQVYLLLDKGFAEYFFHWLSGSWREERRLISLGTQVSSLCLQS